MLLFNIKQIVQIVDNGTEFLAGKDMANVKVLNSADGSLAILTENGLVKEIGPYNVLRNKSKEQVDCHGGTVIPGLVDGHSHPVFAGDRVNEFAMKLAGATYMEVQKAGGGIHFTTEKTREASEDDLLKDFEIILSKMLSSGTTTLEAKSGYGLDTQTELKMLRVIETASKTSPVELSATFCGAHAVPKGSDEQKQTEIIIKEMIPTLTKEKQIGNLNTLENIDVFCEKNVFELESTRKILEAGIGAGLHVNIHADELYPLGGAELAAALQGRAASHLEEISDSGIQEMAKSGTVAVLLPTTAYILRLQPPPARKMIDNGVIVALGSDFNPNAHCLAMPMVMHLACVLFKMSMTEAIVAATLNAAKSIGRGKTHGAISVGRVADLVVIDAPRWEHLIYQFGSHKDLIRFVIKKGSVVYAKKTTPKSPVKSEAEAIGRAETWITSVNAIGMDWRWSVWLWFLAFVKGQGGCGGGVQWPPPPLYLPAPQPLFPPPLPCNPTPCRNCPPEKELPQLVPPPKLFPVAPEEYLNRIPFAPDKVVLKETKVTKVPDSNSSKTEDKPLILPPPIVPQVQTKPLTYTPYYPYGRPVYPTGPPPYQPFPYQPLPQPGCQPAPPLFPAPLPPIQLPPPPPPPPPAPLPPIQLPTLPPPQPFTLPPPIILPPLIPPPLLTCCTQCQPCAMIYPASQQSRGPKNFVAKTLQKEEVKVPADPFCSSQMLKRIMEKARNSTIAIAKLNIQREAESESRGSVYHVICSSTDLDYATRTEEYCTSEVTNGVCYAFKS
ncbi:unnamed protein product [Bursaphelenchus xylophilus]|uniref:Probable imidazolonepropionase n=1 Tax=Bursaphelenchus xylophilus TaxID=6326 RepID=A0A1I7RSS5_BURXY|nr:unnamed protein product [Bursaphelenchus xylophilus]CAG9122818.1 unnamed protein product [Bursaphelenchus xylophilus]